VLFLFFFFLKKIPRAALFSFPSFSPACQTGDIAQVTPFFSLSFFPLSPPCGSGGDNRGVPSSGRLRRATENRRGLLPFFFFFFFFFFFLAHLARLIDHLPPSFFPNGKAGGVVNSFFFFFLPPENDRSPPRMGQKYRRGLFFPLSFFLFLLPNSTPWRAGPPHQVIRVQHSHHQCSFFFPPQQGRERPP